MRKVWLVSLAGAAALAIGATAESGRASIVFDESVSGDLSNSGLTPTSLAFTSGDNQIFGSTGRDAQGVVDRDYFSFTLLADQYLTAITVLPGTTSIGAGTLSFIAIEAGSQVTVLPTTASAAGLLGWTHYSPADIGTDILADMSVPVAGSSGFIPPLGPGTYSVWIQETATGSANFGFNFAVTSVPEPATWAMMIVGFGLIGGAMRRRVGKRIAAAA